MRFAAVAALVGAAVAMPGELAERQFASTTTATQIDTIYSCPPSVTDCPVAAPTVAPGYTQSVVYDYIYHTITACASSVTNCPARISTQTVELYTTICPITATQTVAPVPTTSSVYVAPIQLSYVTYTTCVPSTWVSTITVTPTPSPIISAVPTAYPNGTYSAGYAGPTFTNPNAAASVKGSIFTAAAVALAAVLFA